MSTERGPIDKDAILAHPIESLLHSGAQGDPGGAPMSKPEPADLSRLKGVALRDAKWVLTFAEGSRWLTGAFRTRREAELVKAGVLIQTDEPGVFTVGRAPEKEPEVQAAAAGFVCTWEGHDSAIEEEGFCPVCQ